MALRFVTLPHDPVASLALAAVIGFAALLAGAPPALACEGLGCVGQTVGEGVHDTGVVLEKGVRVTGHAIERGADATGHVVEQGAHAVGEGVQETGKALTGQP